MYACEKTGGAITSSVTISQNLCPRVVLKTNPSSVTSGMWTCGSLRCSAEPCSGVRKRRCGVGHNSKFVGSEHVGSNVAPSISCPVSIILGHAKFLLLAPSSSETIVTWEIFRGFFFWFSFMLWRVAAERLPSNFDHHDEVTVTWIVEGRWKVLNIGGCVRCMSLHLDRNPFVITFADFEISLQEA